METNPLLGFVKDTEGTHDKSSEEEDLWARSSIKAKEKTQLTKLTKKRWWMMKE